MTRLVQQDLERRKVGVPLDQRGDWTEAPERRGIELPNGLCDPGAVVVDQNVNILGGVMPGEMDLTDRGYRGGPRDKRAVRTRNSTR